MAIKNIGQLIDVLQKYDREDPFTLSVSDVESENDFERFFASEIYDCFGGIEGVVFCIDAKSNKDF
jgi:hypothetical protein